MLKTESRGMALEESREIKTLDQLVILPSAGDIFDLDIGNIGKFERLVYNLLGDSYSNRPHGVVQIDEYIFNNLKSLWVPERTNPIIFGGITDTEEGFYLTFGGKGGDNTRSILVILNRKPRFAFLKDKMEPWYMRGLYLSTGASEVNPWGYRHERVYVAEK